MSLKKNNNHRLNKIVLTIVISIIIIISIISLFLHFTARKIVWCYLENNITDPANPKNECVHIKILSKDTDKIDFKKFYGLNITRTGCVDYNDMPSCNGDEYHFTKFELSQLSSMPDIDGIICLAYYVTFYESNNIFIEDARDWYRMKFLEQVNSSYELEEKIINCEEE